MDKHDSSKVDNIAVNDLMIMSSKVKTVDDFTAAQKKIEESIIILHGDLKSIDRQISQREITRSLDEKLGENQHDLESHEQWLFKIKKAIQYKRDQIRALERSLGNARDRVFDRRFIHIDNIFDTATNASAMLDDVDDLLEKYDKENANVHGDNPFIEKIRKLRSKENLVNSINALDRAWENWCE